MEDTICAVSTPPGEGGIGIVRLSGPRSVEIASRIFRSKSGKSLQERPSHQLTYGVLIGEDGCIVDECLAVIMRAPRSYTREDLVEMNCHGGPVVLAAVLRAVLKDGARLAQPGEFTRRAFLSGRIDLAQAEAVLDIVKARTEAGLRTALGQLQGKAAQVIAPLRDKLLELRAHLEVSIDFPDEDIQVMTPEQMGQVVNEVSSQTRALIENADKGKIYREGATVAIVGRPNVGKSSLFNALLRAARAIVTSVPGTTRDAIEESVNIDGVLFTLVDSAGIRQTEDQVEQLGVKVAEGVLYNADLALLVLDASDPLRQEDMALVERLKNSRKKVIAVLNKTDLPARVSTADIQAICGDWSVEPVSALSGSGISSLENSMVQLVFGGVVVPAESVALTRIRHVQSLEKALGALEELTRGIEAGASADLLAVDLKEALDAYGEILGEVPSDELLNRIFGEFCIGK